MRHRPPGSRPVIVNGELRWVAGDGQPLAVASGSAAIATSATSTSAPTNSYPRRADGTIVTPPTTRQKIAALFRLMWKGAVLLAANILSWLKSNPRWVAAFVAYVVLLRVVNNYRWGTVITMVAFIVLLLTKGLSRTPMKPGELSAYSIFNPGYQSLPGQLKSEHFDSEIRGGAGGMQRHAQAEIDEAAGWGGPGRALGGAAAADADDAEADADEDFDA